MNKKTITIDGKEYVEKTEEKKEAMTLTCYSMNTEHTIGLGMVKLEKARFISIKMSIRLIKKALKALEPIYEKDDAIHLAFAQDEALIIGGVDKKKLEATGIIVAARKDEEE